MSALGDGRFYAGLAQSGLQQAASDEQQRNIQNDQLKRQDKANNAQLGATVGAAIGSFIFPGVGTAIGGLLGGFAGSAI